MLDDLTDNEKLVLWGLHRFPNATIKELSELLALKRSTTASIKNRLKRNRYFFEINIPMLNRLGYEILAVGVAKFNSLIPLNQRFEKSIELIKESNDLFLAVEGQHLGLSFGFFKNYTIFRNFEEEYAMSLANQGFLEGILPNYVLFPFKNSNIRIFFDFWRLLEEKFSLKKKKKNDIIKSHWFGFDIPVDLTDKEKLVLIALTEFPNATLKQIGEGTNLSRVSVGRIKNKFFTMGLIRKLLLPNLLKLGFNILVLYHIKFNPKKIPQNEDFEALNSNYSLFFAHSNLETFIISTYENYKEYSQDRMQKVNHLKENNLIIDNPMIYDILIDKMRITKAFDASLILRALYDINKTIFSLDKLPAFRSLKETL